MAGEFWLDDEQWAVIEPLLPTHQSGAHRKDDRRLNSPTPLRNRVLPASVEGTESRQMHAHSPRRAAPKSNRCSSAGGYWKS
jgi:transposase